MTAQTNSLSGHYDPDADERVEPGDEDENDELFDDARNEDDEDVSSWRLS